MATRTPSFRSALTAVVRVSHISDTIHTKVSSLTEFHELLAVHPVGQKYNKTIETLCLKAVDWDRDDVSCRPVETDMSKEVWNLVMSEEVWNLVKGAVTTAEMPNTPTSTFSKQMYDYDLLLAVHPVSHKYNKTIESLCLKAVDWDRDDVTDTPMSMSEEVVWNLIKGTVTTAEMPNAPTSIFSKRMATYDYDLCATTTAFKALCRPKPHVIAEEFPKAVDLLVIHPNCCRYTQLMNECLCLKAAELDLDNVSRRFGSNKSPTAYGSLLIDTGTAVFNASMTQAAAEVVRICESFGIKPDVFAYSYNGVIRSIAGQEGNAFAYSKKHETNKAMKLMDVKPKPLKKRRESGKTKLHGEDQNILIVHDNDFGLAHSIAYQRGAGTNITATSLYTKGHIKLQFR